MVSFFKFLRFLSFFLVLLFNFNFVFSQEDYVSKSLVFGGGGGDVCVPYFEFTVWSDCGANSQSRYAIDLNSCFGDLVQTRYCENNVSEIDLIFNNSAEVNLTSVLENFYVSNFSQSFEAIKLDSSVYSFENNFVVYDLVSGLEYVAVKIDSSESFNYFYLELVDFEILSGDELYDRKILKKGFFDNLGDFYTDLRESSSFSRILVVLVNLFILIFVMFMVFMFKRNTRKKKLNELAKAKVSTLKENAEHTFSTDGIYSKYFLELDAYIKKNPGVNKDVLRARLESIGWNKDILDAYFNRN